MSEQLVGFDRVTARRFVRAVRDFLTSEVRWQARGLFALLILQSLDAPSKAGESYLANPGRCAFALGHRCTDGFVPGELTACRSYDPYCFAGDHRAT